MADSFVPRNVPEVEEPMDGTYGLPVPPPDRTMELLQTIVDLLKALSEDIKPLLEERVELAAYKAAKFPPSNQSIGNEAITPQDT